MAVLHAFSRLLYFAAQTYLVICLPSSRIYTVQNHLPYLQTRPLIVRLLRLFRAIDGYIMG